MKQIPLARPFFDENELIEIQEVLESGWVSQGPKVKQFEEKIANYLNADHVIAVSNCTAALHLALLSVGVTKGEEVLVADYTFPATGHSVVYCGAKPIFVDVDSRTYNIDPDKIESKITEKTKAIIPVHTFGQTAEMDKILKIADKYDLRVIEDAACAFGAKYCNKSAGTIGDIGCFSLHARKGITTGEGGLIATQNKNLADILHHLSVFGMKSAWEREDSQEYQIPVFSDVGFNYKMSDITAAVGVAQLRKIEAIIKRKQELAKYWGEKIDEIDFIEKPYVGDDCYHIYQSYVCLVDPKINRNKLIIKLLAQGVQTQIGTYASHIQPVYESKDICPISLDIYNRGLALPMFYSLSNDEIDVAAKILEKTLGELI